MKFGAVPIFLVIPGPAEGRNPEFRNKLTACIWIPGPLAARASRNDGGGVA